MRGNPTGILFIGMGVFLLAMGFTGKLQEVWTALTSGVSLPTGPDNPMDTPQHPTPEGGHACQADPQCKPGYKCVGGICSSTEQPTEGDRCAPNRIKVRVQETNEIKCALQQDLKAINREGPTCSAGYVTVIYESQQGTKLYCWARITGAGEAMAYHELPTGVIGLRESL